MISSTLIRTFLPVFFILPMCFFMLIKHTLLHTISTHDSLFHYLRRIIPHCVFFLLLLLAQELADARRALSERLSSLEREESSRLGSNHRLYQPFAKLFGSMITIIPTIPVNER